jgi:hypothetical protein
MDMERMTRMTQMERMTQRKQQMSPARRRRVGMRGTTVVELAFILPFFLLLTLGALHYGWLFYHLHRVTNATRHAARVGTLVGRDKQDIINTITEVLGLTVDKWPNYSLDVDNPAEVNIQTFEDDGFTIPVDGVPVPGIRVGISLQTEKNPRVTLIKKIPFGPFAPEALAATVTMAKEGG